MKFLEGLGEQILLALRGIFKDLFIYYCDSYIDSQEWNMADFGRGLNSLSYAF